MTTTKTLTARVSALQTMPLDELADEYTRLYGRVPRLLRRRWLFRRVAWGLQAEARGGLSATAQARLDEIIGELGVTLDSTAEPRPAPAVKTRQRRDGLTVGTVLSRTWHDREIRVTIREAGFEWEGVLFASLSAVARAVTGARWSGQLFFGLRQRSTRR